MIGRIAATALFAMAVGQAPALALTAKEKMATCQFGADHQKLAGAARKAFLSKCMSNRDSPRGKPAPKTQ
jgi:hypothetical protein